MRPATSSARDLPRALLWVLSCSVTARATANVIARNRNLTRRAQHTPSLTHTALVIVRADARDAGIARNSTPDLEHVLAHAQAGHGVGQSRAATEVSGAHANRDIGGRGASGTDVKVRSTCTCR